MWRESPVLTPQRLLNHFTTMFARSVSSSQEERAHLLTGKRQRENKLQSHIYPEMWLLAHRAMEEDRCKHTQACDYKLRVTVWMFLKIMICACHVQRSLKHLTRIRLFALHMPWKSYNANTDKVIACISGFCTRCCGPSCLTSLFACMPEVWQGGWKISFTSSINECPITVVNSLHLPQKDAK